MGQVHQRETVPLQKRKPLTRAQALQLCVDQGGVCGCGCGEKLQPIAEGVIDEHVLALGLTGGNELDNRSLWRKPCTKPKTKADHGSIGKAKRLAAGPKTSKRPIQGRGFDKTKTRGFDQKVRPRKPRRKP